MAPPETATAASAAKLRARDGREAATPFPSDTSPEKAEAISSSRTAPSMPRGADARDLRASFFSMDLEAGAMAALGTAGAGASDGGGGAGSSARVVSACGSTAIAPPSSVSIGRPGITGRSNPAVSASGASATRVSLVLLQSSPDRFCTMPQSCKCAGPLPSTRRYDGRHTGASAM